MIQLPLFETPSTWAPPSHLPDLSHAKEIAIDTETRDPDLKTKGPGYIYKNGHVAGIGIAADTGFKGYFPINHQLGGNLDKKVVCSWVAETCGRADVDYVFANAQYDLGWLRTEGIEVKGRIHDIQIADTLIDEENHEGYGLNALCKRWLGERKEETLLAEACRNYGFGNTKADLWRLPARLVGPYGEKDPDQTLRIWQKQKPVLRAQGLWPVYEIESKLIRVLFEMFWRGIRVDLPYAQKLNQEWLVLEKEVSRPFQGYDIWNAEHLTRFFQKEGIQVPRDKKTGAPSIQKEWLEAHDSKIVNQLRTAREIQRTRSIYLEQNLITNVGPDERIHPQYIQMASDEGGTRTRRLAAKNPNSQQFPKRSRSFPAKKLRHALIPEEGCLWAKQDYWSQEPTFMVHYGLTLGLPKAQDVAEAFARKEKLYTYIEKATKGRCDYDQSKIVVLGRSYGMGVNKMARDMHMPMLDCKEALEAFDREAAFITLLSKKARDIALERGYVRSILGGRRRFNFWESRSTWDEEKRRFVKLVEGPPLPYDKARQLYGEAIQRAHTHKAFNGIIQPSAAEQTKKAMVDIYEAIGLPGMQVHDEISKSVQNEAEAKLMNEIMVNAIPLKCVVQADMDLGPHWL